MQCVGVLPIKTIRKGSAKLKHEMVRLARFALRMPGCSRRQASMATIARVAGLFVLVAGVSASAQTPQTAEATIPAPSACSESAPAFTQLTYDENNRYFSNPNCRTGFLDRIKFIPLRGDKEDYYISFGVFTRDRGEYFSHFDLGSGPAGNAYLMQRYFVHMDLHLSDRFRFFGELASSLETGRNGGPRPALDEKQLYVHQGFFDIGLWQSGKNSLTLRAGRQEMVLGSENLISTRDGRNIRRSFDGFRLTWLTGNWTIDAFALKVVLDNSGYFDDPPNHTESFWCVCAVTH